MRVLFYALVLLLISGCDLNVGGTKSGDKTDTTTTIINEEIPADTGAGFGENPRCVGVQSLDGTGGFLWKPESEADGNLVILFPAEFVSVFVNVFAFPVESGEAQVGTFAGFTNDSRQTYRFPRPGGDYTGRVLADAGDQECEWLVPDPSSRQD